jgi:hypothetical protein
MEERGIVARTLGVCAGERNDAVVRRSIVLGSQAGSTTKENDMNIASVCRRIARHDEPSVDRTAVEHPRGKPLRRMARVASIGALLATVGGGVLAPAASAGVVTQSGSIGYVGLPTGNCTHYPSWSRLDVTTQAPTIYAPNLRAGGGNDSAWVRYQVFVVDSSRTVRAESTVSGWAAAYDNRAATFSGSALTFTSIPNFSTVWMVVEWYGMGSAVYKLDKYQNYVKGLTYPYGPTDSCAKYTPPTYIG